MRDPAGWVQGRVCRGQGMRNAGYAILLCMCPHTARDPAGWVQGHIYTSMRAGRAPVVSQARRVKG